VNTTSTFGKGLIAILAASLLCGIPFASNAATTTGNLNVTATISNNCHFGVSNMPFGAYDPTSTNASTPLTATGTVHITCTTGAPFALTADAGLNGGSASGTCATAACTRAMKSGTNFLSYDLYTTNARTTVWNGTNSIPATGTGALQIVDVFGYVPAGSAQPAGAYTDTVTVTATY